MPPRQQPEANGVDAIRLASAGYQVSNTFRIFSASWSRLKGFWSR